jgi:hypothetical protein
MNYFFVHNFCGVIYGILVKFKPLYKTTALYFMTHTRLILFSILFSSFFAFSQDWTLPFSSRIEKSGKKLQGATVTLMQGSSKVSETMTGDDGAFKFQIPPNGDFTIVVTKPGHCTKKFTVSTRGVPEDKKAGDFKGFNVESISLFEPLPGIDYSVLNQPLVKVNYDATKDNFDYDEAYSNQMLSALERLRQLELDALNKQKELEANYAASIKAGDNAFKKKDWVMARAGYNQALTFKSAELYPKAQLAQIEIIIKDQEALNKKAEADKKAAEDAAKAASDAAAKKVADEAAAKKAAEDAAAKKAAEDQAKADAEAARLAKEKADKELADKLAKDAAAKKAADEAAAKKAAEDKAKADADAAAKKAAEDKAKADAETARLAKEKADKELADKLAKEAADKKAAADAAAKKLADEAAAKKAAEDKAKADAEVARLAKEKADKEALDKLSKEEAAKKITADAAAKKLADEAAAKKATEDKAKAEAEAARLAKEEAAKKAAEDKAKAEAEAARLAKEKADKEANEKLSKEDAAKKAAADKLEADRLAKETAIKKAAEDKAKAEAEAARLAKEKADKEANDKLSKDEAAKKAAADKLEADRLAKEKADKEANDKLSKEDAAKKAAADKLEADRLAKEEAARLAKEKAAKEAAEAAANKVKTTPPPLTVDKYKEAKDKADALFNMKRYQEAKLPYEEALIAKAGDSYAKGKLAEIEKLLKSDAAVAVNVDAKKKALLDKYAPGITEETIIGTGVVILQRVVVKETDVYVYQKKMFSWGGISYFRDAKAITESTFEQETKP